MVVFLEFKKLPIASLSGDYKIISNKHGILALALGRMTEM